MLFRSDSGIAYHEPTLAEQLKEPEPHIELADTLKSPPAAPRGVAAGRSRGKARRSQRRGMPRAAASAPPPASVQEPIGSSGVRKRPSMSRPPSARIHKRARATTTPPSPHTGAVEPAAFGSAISIVVSYSRLILIAVYSHLLLLDQANQIYWRFLTVAITLLLWGLEIVIATEDVVVGGVGELGSAAARS